MKLYLRGIVTFPQTPASITHRTLRLLNTTEKEKPPSVDSDFSCIVLTVYKLTETISITTADVVHPLHSLAFDFPL